MKKTESRQVTFYMDRIIYEKFSEKYRNISSNFFRRCVFRALENPDFFQDVFFNTKDLKSEEI